jgi:hypothetical protein
MILIFLDFSGGIRGKNFKGKKFLSWVFVINCERVRIILNII